MARRTKKTTLQPVIFDTDVLIWFFRGNLKAQNLFKSTDQDYRWLSSLTLMELFQGCRNQEELLNVEAFVSENISQIVHPKTSISEKAIHLIHEYCLSHGLRLVDAVIAGSALLKRAILVTGNKRHFSFISGLSLKIYNP